MNCGGRTEGNDDSNRGIRGRGQRSGRGELVTVRNRVLVVSDVTPSSLAAQPGSVTGRPTHVVALVSIEDDARDEQLRVVWELERGAVVHDQHTLPDPADGFDDPGQLDAFLDAVCWGAIASADKTVLQAPFRSGVSIADYQLDPVVRAKLYAKTVAPTPSGTSCSGWSSRTCTARSAESTKSSAGNCPRGRFQRMLAG